MDKKSNLAFRTFVYEKWQEHQEELLAWTRAYPEYNQRYYFIKHRWMLRRMYRQAVK
jgi:hypothetical protein